MDFSQISQLSIGVVAILALGYVTKMFIAHLRELHTDHLKELKERELAMRSVEKEVRESITSQLVKNTHVMERALIVLEK